MRKEPLLNVRRVVCLAALLSLLSAGTAVAAPASDAPEVDTVAVGGTPGAVAVSPDGGQVFVTVDDRDEQGGPVTLVKVVDAGTGDIDATVPLPRSGTSGAGRVTFSPDGTLAYALSGQSVTVIDTDTDTVLRSFTVPDQPRPSGRSPGPLKSVAVSPDGASLYVGQDGPTGGNPWEGRGRLLVFASATGTLTGSTALTGPRVADVLVRPDGKDGYVSTEAGGLLHLDLTTASPTVLRRIYQPGGEGGANGAALTADGGKLYYLVTRYNWVREVSTADDGPHGTLSSTPVVPMYTDARSPMLSHDGSRFYVVDNDPKGPTVGAMDTATHKVLGPVAGVKATDVRGAAVSADDSTLYLAGSTGAAGGGILQFLPAPQAR
ncbi:YncE family protein [Streptomyces olivoreticuli]